MSQSRGGPAAASKGPAEVEEHDGRRLCCIFVDLDEQVGWAKVPYHVALCHVMSLILAHGRGAHQDTMIVAIAVIIMA